MNSHVAMAAAMGMDFQKILGAMGRYNSSCRRPGKWRDTKKKLNRRIRKNRMIMTRNSRRDNR